MPISIWSSNPTAILSIRSMILGSALILLPYRVLAQTELPEPVVQFSFENAKDPHLTMVRGTPQFVEGLKGNALVIGDPRQVCYWDSAPLGFNWEEVTLSFWYMPVNWQDKGRMRYWLNATQEPGKGFLRLMHMGGPDTTSTLCLQMWHGHPKHDQCHSLANRTESYFNGKWYFVTVTWKKGEASLYLNGKMDPNPKTRARATGTAIWMPSEIGGNRLYIGRDLNWEKRKYATVETSLIDELEIRDMALDAAQVRLLHYQQKQELAGK